VLKKFRKMLKKQEGFTLVELMVAVVILGILAGIGVQQYGRIQRDAKIAAHNANVRIITNAANMYIMMYDEAPESVDDLATEFLQEVPKPPAGLNYEADVSIRPSTPWMSLLQGKGKMTVVHGKLL